MSGDLFSCSEFRRLNNVVDFLENNRFCSNVEGVLEGYVYSAGFSEEVFSDADEYLAEVDSASSDLRCLDSMYTGSELEANIKNEIMDLASNAYISMIKSGVSRGVDPVLDQPYDTRKNNVSKAIKLAYKYQGKQ